MNKFVMLIIISIFFACTSIINPIEDYHDHQSIAIGFKGLILTGDLIKEFEGSLNNDLSVKSECDNWEIKKESLSQLLKTMRLVESYEWNALCYNYPCYYQGRVVNELEQYEIFINAGGYITLKNQKNSFRFIMETPTKMFLDVCNCCE